MDYSSIAIWVAVLTLVLIVAEIFIPSGGLITIFAIITGVISIWAAWKAWYHDSPAIWWIYLISFIAAIPTVAIGNILILPRTKWGRRLMPDPVPAEQTRPFTKEREKLQQLVGSMGTTATLHTPGGITVIDGKRYHSESQSLLIEPDTPVKVVGIDGTRIVIREAAPQEQTPADESDAAADNRLTKSDHLSEPEEKLDFPFPEE